MGHVVQDVEDLLARAMEKRTVGCTQLNEQSSRSHAVFTLRIEGVNDSSKLKVGSHGMYNAHHCAWVVSPCTWLVCLGMRASLQSTGWRGHCAHAQDLCDQIKLAVWLGV
jgi:hypothetical protein